MEHPPEWEIRFRPGQGATGATFLTAKLRTVKREYLITDEYKDILHKDLKWIVSIPIKSPTQRTIAVLNIDILRHQVSEDRLTELETHLHEQIIQLAKGFGDLPLQTVDLIVRKAA